MEEEKKWLEEAYRYGADFVEFYFEKSKMEKYQYKNAKLESIVSERTNGLGIRLLKEDKIYYAAITNPNHEKVMTAVERFCRNFSKKEPDKVSWEEERYAKRFQKIPFQDVKDQEKKEFLRKLDTKVRESSSFVAQVQASITEESKVVTILNSDGLFRTEERPMLSFVFRVFAKRDETIVSDYFSLSQGMGYEMLEKLDLDEEVKRVVSQAVSKLDAKEGPSGTFPVVLEKGFGGTVFHEACGHPLEIQRVYDHSSVFWNVLGKEIASSNVTLIDDGGLDTLHGTTMFDDEGTPTKKNVLIENGVLKQFLADTYYGKKAGQVTTGSCRRKDYFYIPVPRMNNTYLANGKDKVEDMIQSIPLGLYCFGISGGSVNTVTGDFTFGISGARMIRDGHLAEYVKNVALIGNAKDILKSVEMVSSDLSLQPGYCGAESGWIPVTAGQPTIKLSSIMIGGKEQ